MSKPKVPNHDLNQSTVDAITARIDAYDQAWETRMVGLFEAVERIATGVEEIRDFIGTSAEQQKAVELRIVSLEEKIDTRFDQIARNQEKTDARFDQLTRNIDQLVTAVNNTSNQEKIDARFDQLTHNIDQLVTAVNNTSNQEKIDARFDQLTRNIDQLVTAVNNTNTTVNGYQLIAQEQAKTTQELIRMVTVIVGKAAA